MRLTFVDPMLPTLVEQAPRGSDWIHEIKHDGYRTQLIIQDGKAKTFTRRGIDWTDRYRLIVATAEELPAMSAIIDGEMILPTRTGSSDFAAFRRAIKGNPAALAFVAFDILHLDGEDLRSLPLLERKDRLWRLVGPAASAIQFSPHVAAGGQSFFEAVERMGLEGMVSKRPDSVYRSGSTEVWLKTKCFTTSELEVVAVLRERGKPAVAYMVDLHRQYVGGAFIALNQTLRDRLWKRVQATAPGQIPRGMPHRPGAEWLKPGLIGRVRHLRGEEELRHATLQEIWETAPS